MINFTIESSKNSKYIAVIYSLNINGPFSDIEMLNNQLVYQVNRLLWQGEKKGLILFDLLLSHGKGYNRFATMTFNGKKLNMKSFKIEKVSDDIREFSTEFYKNKIEKTQPVVILNEEDILKFLKVDKINEIEKIEIKFENVTINKEKLGEAS